MGGIWWCLDESELRCWKVGSALEVIYWRGMSIKSLAACVWGVGSVEGLGMRVVDLVEREMGRRRMDMNVVCILCVCCVVLIDSP